MKNIFIKNEKKFLENVKKNFSKKIKIYFYKFIKKYIFKNKFIII
jgi:hypothetical protein